jgi:hypothetical protein
MKAVLEVFGIQFKNYELAKAFAQRQANEIKRVVPIMQRDDGRDFSMDKWWQLELVNPEV